jgi:L-seryl-tRNA(Ser) seleniumtransferase
MDDLRSLPKVDALSRSPELQAFPERVRIAAARQAVDDARKAIQAGTGLNGRSIEDLALAKAEELNAIKLRPAVNLSGVILHTGLGRARLAQAAVENMAAVAAQHSLLELDDESGKRGDRQAGVRDLLKRLTGAEDALVVNNAAAGVVLSLRALAGDREVVLSRGQMVEIGGSFRMPDIVRESGCRLTEVGCTNKTRLGDYEEVLGDRSGAILCCHTSNFKIIGFAEQPALADLVRLSHKHGLPCIDDMGTGCIVDTSAFGIPRTPTIQDSLAAGADVVIASGDKLLGGPQAGLILGSAAAIQKIKSHPLARAVRIDKLSLAALEATLMLYAQGREGEIPTIAYLSRTLDQVRELAQKLSACIEGSVVAEGFTEVGGGSAPGVGIRTWRVGVKSPSADALARKLRAAEPCIVGRIEDDLVWLDPRTLDLDEVDVVCEVLRSL